MNTEDKLYSDGSNEMDAFIDIFTDHYVPPVGCYGPMVAKAHGKGSMETETWFVNSEYSLPQGVVQFLASGQSRIAPWHPRVLFDSLPGNPDRYAIPAPVTVATAAFNSMATGKPFEKMVFADHLPFAFQFGMDDDKDGLVIVFGRLMPIGSENFRVLLWPQVNSSAGGTMRIENGDGLLEFNDLAGNRVHRDEKTVEVPLSFLPTYIKSAKGPSAVAQRLKEARIEGKRFVEIVPALSASKFRRNHPACGAPQPSQSRSHRRIESHPSGWHHLKRRRSATGDPSRRRSQDAGDPGRARGNLAG
jgi:hypothetical protein